MKKLKVTAITNWLVSVNMLEVVKINNKNAQQFIIDNLNSIIDGGYN